MKTIKNKLFISTIVVVLTFIALGSTAFAWFSLNTTVNATGMQIQAKSDSVHLLISSFDQISRIQRENTVSATPVDLFDDGSDDYRILPCTHDYKFKNMNEVDDDNSESIYYYRNNLTNEDISPEEYNALTIPNKEDLYTEIEFGGATYWYYRYADQVDSSESTSLKRYIVAEGLRDYLRAYICYVTLAKGSPDAYNLKVTGATFTSDNSATGTSATLAPIRVLVATPYGATEVKSTAPSSNDILVPIVPDDDVIPVMICIYYDGNDQNVYTNNSMNLDGASISLTFSVSDTNE